jgi:hypothetical protein
MTMRRLSLVFVLVAALAGCSSGSTNVASPTKTTETTVASPTSEAASPTVAPTSSDDSAGGGATDFCSAFKELDVAKSSNTPAAFGAAFEAAAADMRKYAPAEIKDAAETYADVIENIGKTAQAGKMDEAGRQKALVAGMAGKAADIGKVAVWASQNCKL